MYSGWILNTLKAFEKGKISGGSEGEEKEK